MGKCSENGVNRGRKKEGIPIEEKVEEIFFPIIPDLPVPDITIFPFLQFKIVLTAFSNEIFIFRLSFLKDVISVSITFLAIILNFLIFILFSVQKL